MKILYLSRAPFGTMGTNASYMIPTHMNDYADVAIMSPTEVNKNQPIVYNNSHNIRIIPVNEKAPDKKSLEIAATIEKEKPDIVHMFYHPDCIRHSIKNKLKAKHKPKWVVDIRTPLFYLNSWPLFKEKSKNILFNWFVDAIATHELASVETVSYWQKKPSYLIPLGTTVNSESVVATKDYSKLRRFIFVGSIAKSRKLDFLVDAFSALNKYSDKQFSLDIYGTGNGMTLLEKKIASEDMQNSIKLMGAVLQHELFNIIRTYDAGIGYVPYENFYNAPSLKVLEYCAAQIPVFASNIAWCQRLNQNGFKLMLFKNTVDAFCQEVLQYCDTDLSSNVVANSEHVKAFDWGYIVKNRVLPLYESLLQ